MRFGFIAEDEAMNVPVYMRRKQSGVAVIELAITLIFLLLLTMGITEIGRAFWYYSALQKATRDGARYVSMQSWAGASPVSACKTSVKENAVSAGVPSVDASGTSLENRVSVLCDGAACSWGSGTAPEYITVVVDNFRMHWLWSFGAPMPSPGGSAGLRIQATMPYMR